MSAVLVFDYGVGNLHSLARALGRNGHSVRVTRDVAQLDDAVALVLPGVGAFTPAAEALAPHLDTLRQALARGLPCLGICLGMQLLFESSEEGPGAGLAVIPGRVRGLVAERVPQMGWNSVAAGPDALFAGASELVVYYANSYVALPARATDVIAWSEYGADRFPAAVRTGRVAGVQFHPEKSAAPGLRIIDNFLLAAR
jgi:glutamine amidotransferase